MLFYSWPSKATLSGYGADGETIGRTLKKFISFLDLLLAIPEVTAINVIAHSMGNRLFQRAMQLLSVRNDIKAKRFGHVVLAAPISTERRSEKPRTTTLSSSKTRSQNHGVLQQKRHRGRNFELASRRSARRYKGNALLDTDSILWIDSWFRLDWLGHGYFASAAPVLKDMKGLLVENKTPRSDSHP